MKNSSTKKQFIRSFVKREGRLTKSQQYALDNYWEKYGINLTTGAIDSVQLFKRHAPLIIDIGVGTGDSTYHHAAMHPENNYLAIEVHRPGLGQLINKIESNNLTNVKVSNDDVVDVLAKQIPDNAVSQIFIFFADPWPKKRHHKRRLINTALLELITQKMVRHGRLHIATDWEDYAIQIEELCSADPVLVNLAGNKLNFSPRPNWRIQTRYESRGLRLDHKVWDFCYGFAK